MLNMKDPMIVVCSQSFRQKLLKELSAEHKLCEYTFMSIEELRDNFYFTLTPKAYCFAMDFLKTNYSIAKKITDNLYYVNLDGQYEDAKLKQLVVLKKALMDANLLDRNSLFPTFLARHEVMVVDLELSAFEQKMLQEIENITKVHYYNTSVEKKEFLIHIFDHYEEEVDYCFSQIATLLSQGADINKLYIACESASYYHLLRRYSYLYGIPLALDYQDSILSTPAVKEFMKLVRQGVAMGKVMEKIKPITTEGVYKQLINLVNKYYFEQDYLKLADIFQCELKSITYENELYEDVVQVVKFDRPFQEDDIVFIINFSNGNLPKLYRNNDYLDDRYAKEVCITTSDYKNQMELKKVVKHLFNIANPRISFSKRTDTNQVISNVVSELDFKMDYPTVLVGISERVDEYRLGTYLDDYRKFNLKHKNLLSLASSFDQRYLTYDNQVQFLDKELIKKRLNNTIKLSYTSLSSFYKCQFAFLLERILYIPYEHDESAAHLGTAFHSILEALGTPDFDLEQEKAKQIETLTSIEERFYFEKLFPDLERVIQFILEMRVKTQLVLEKHESEFVMDYSDHEWTRIFKGFVDKIMYQEIDGTEYLVIIDYKSSSLKSSLDNIEDGFNLQLPVYAYFVSKSSSFINPKILGIYLHHFVNDVKNDDKKSVEELLWNEIKLDGYSIDNPSELAIFDPDFASGKYIKSMSYTDKGFGRYAKIMSEEDLAMMIHLVVKLLLDAFTKIEQGDFVINPKLIKDKNKSCEFCGYADICYKSRKNEVNLEEKKFIYQKEVEE